MSRSKRKNPICGITTAVSEKEDKRKWHRKNRKKVNSLLDIEDYDELELESYYKRDGNWSFSKDGKTRFDEDEYGYLMRK